MIGVDNVTVEYNVIVYFGSLLMCKKELMFLIDSPIAWITLVQIYVIWFYQFSGIVKESDRHLNPYTNIIRHKELLNYHQESWHYEYIVGVINHPELILRTITVPRFMTYRGKPSDKDDPNSPNLTHSSITPPLLSFWTGPVQNFTKLNISYHVSSYSTTEAFERSTKGTSFVMSGIWGREACCIYRHNKKFRLSRYKFYYLITCRNKLKCLVKVPYL